MVVNLKLRQSIRNTSSHVLYVKGTIQQRMLLMTNLPKES